MGAMNERDGGAQHREPLHCDRARALDTENWNGEEIPCVNSELGSAVVHMLHARGFPQHRIGALFDTDHGYVAHVLISDAGKIRVGAVSS
jgi:hypothetical protein